MKYFTTAFVAFAFSFSLSSAHKEDVPLYDEIEIQVPKIQPIIEELPYSELTLVDPHPTTRLDIVSLNLFPTEYEKDVIARLEKGIYQAKLHPKSGESYWFECGKRYTEEEAQDRAYEWAYHIVKAVHDASGNPYLDDNPYMLNYWGVAGTVYNESGFDECTLGLKVREYGVKGGYLKKKRMAVSYSQEEVLSLIRTRHARRAFRQTGFDLGPLQVLDKYLSNKLTLKDMLTLEKSIYAQAKNMKERGVWYKIDRPWLAWPNSRIKENSWYDKKVVRRAKKLGAYDWEI